MNVGQGSPCWIWLRWTNPKSIQTFLGCCVHFFPRAIFQRELGSTFNVPHLVQLISSMICFVFCLFTSPQPSKVSPSTSIPAATSEVYRIQHPESTVRTGRR